MGRAGERKIKIRLSPLPKSEAMGRAGERTLKSRLPSLDPRPQHRQNPSKQFIQILQILILEPNHNYPQPTDQRIANLVVVLAEIMDFAIQLNRNFARWAIKIGNEEKPTPIGFVIVDEFLPTKFVTFEFMVSQCLPEHFLGGRCLLPQLSQQLGDVGIRWSAHFLCLPLNSNPPA